MGYRFTADEFRALSPRERVRRCLVHYAEAQQLAASAPPQLKPHYVGIAEQWAELAKEIEQQNNFGAN
jgi:hypothetical protein